MNSLSTASDAGPDSEPIDEPEIFVGAPGLTGVVLVNIGTPASTSVEDVKEYLIRFLGDKPVMDIEDPEEKQAVLERILESRPAKSAESYSRIWDPDRGSPLLYHTEDLAASLQQALGEAYDVCIGFQYSEPSMETALMRFMSLGAEKIILVPMFPHFAEATVGAFLANTSRTAAKLGCSAYLQVVPPFYKNPGYVEAAQQLIKDSVGPGGRSVDHVVFSFHGIPESQCTRTDETESVCMRIPNCCSRRCEANRNCYRAQCLETARLLARSVELPDDHWSAAFQSRRAVRGSIRWTKPYTDELLAELPKRGCRRVAICAPSYTVDCIETLGELGHDGREIFEAAGGSELLLIPCLNASETWTHNLARLILRPPTATEGGGYWAM